jgi:hypothetical protein
MELKQNSAISKKICYSIMFPRSSAHRFTWTSHGKDQKQIDNISMDSGWNSNVLTVQSFKAAECDSGHNKVDTELGRDGSE